MLTKKQLRLTGSTKSWKSSTGEATTEGLVKLLTKSANIRGYKLTINACDQEDDYEVEGSADQVKAFTEALVRLMNAHHKGIAAMEAALTDEQFSQYGNKVFINWGEPVIGVRLVVILFNPVSTYEYDQRPCDTVKDWWKMFEKHTFAKARRWLETRTAFVDLVPILDCGKGDGTANELVNAAAADAACTQYVMSRLEPYINAGTPIALASGNGSHENRFKTNAVEALKARFAERGVEFSEYPCHPRAFGFTGYPGKETSLATYKALNEQLYAKVSIQWQLEEDKRLGTQNVTIAQLASAQMWTACIDAEEKRLAETDNSDADADVKAACLLEMIVCQLQLKLMAKQRQPHYFDQDKSLTFGEAKETLRRMQAQGCASEFLELASALIVAVETYDYHHLQDALQGNESRFTVRELFQVASDLVPQNGYELIFEEADGED